MTAYSTFIEAKAKHDAEEAKRNEIRYSDKFCTLNVQIDGLKAEQEEMLKEVPDSSAEYETAKQEMIAFLEASHQSHFMNVVAKYRVTNKVNVRKVIEVLKGDLDRTYELVEISQKKLLAAAKDDPILSHDLKGCIEEVGKEIVDVELVLPATAA